MNPIDRLKEFNKLDFDSVFPFGQYRGEDVQDVLEENPSYIIWWHENVSSHPLKKCVVSEAELKGSRA